MTESIVQHAVNAIIRPPRAEYDESALPLVLDAGDNEKYCRFPVNFQNERGQSLVGSIYYVSKYNPLNGGPCIMYLHGNASSQLEGQFLVPNFCPHGLFVFCFDFAGCGESDGDYVSLGYFETQDVNFLIKTLHKQFAMGPFVLWGRSMGAATTLLVDNPYVIAKISDSSFTSVPDMCAAIAKSMSLPSMFIPAVIWFLKKKVLQAADFDLETISPLNCPQEAPVPCVFGHAEGDKFIPFEQCRQLYDNYENPMKHIMILDGGHNSKRDLAWITLGVTFALDMLSVRVDDLKISECRKLQSASYHFGSFETMLSSARETNNTATISDLQEFQKQQEKEAEQSEEKKKEKKEKKEKHKHGSKDEKKEKKKHMTPEEKAERKKEMEERHKKNEEKRAKKKAKAEAKAKKLAEEQAKLNQQETTEANQETAPVPPESEIPKSDQQ